MIRVFLVLIAVLAAVFAFVFEQPWLYAVAGLFLLTVLALLGRRLWDLTQPHTSSSPQTSPPNSSLDDLGITEVRPHEREGSGDGAADGSSTKADARSAPPESHAAVEEPSRREGDTGPAHVGDEEGTESSSEGADEGTDRPEIDPLLESLRAAVDAETVALLVQEDVILEYRIAGMASQHADVQTTGTFETESPLLTATMSRQSVTVEVFDDDDPVEPAYYRSVPPIQQRALIPIPRPDAASTVFLAVDATGTTELDSSRARGILQQYGETVRLLREPEWQPESVSTTSSSPQPSRESSAKDDQGGSADQPRPRREIIREEMQAADAGDDDLALVLVHLNRAESIAREGAAAVESAERRLRTRLEHFAAGQRVERFGELTYGIFPRHDVHEVESWAAELQDVMAQETGELEGGVSVGVAVRRPRHDAEGLRADATEALREAYKTGTCTVVA